MQRRRRVIIIGLAIIFLGTSALLLARSTPQGLSAGAVPERAAEPVVPTPSSRAPSPARVTIGSMDAGTERRLARFTGEVVDAEGAPIAGAQVAFWGEGAEGGAEARTDGNGQFSFEAEAGVWNLDSISAAGYLDYDSDPTSYRAAAGAVFEGLRFELTRSRGVHGKIITTSGTPIAGALVRVVEMMGFLISPGELWTSDARGEFNAEIAAARPTEQKLMVSHSCCLQKEVAIPEGDKELELTIVLEVAAGPKSVFSGIVVTEAGAPVPEARVVVTAAVPLDAGLVYENETADTDSLGRFSMSVRSSAVRAFAFAGTATSEHLEFHVTEVARLVLHEGGSSAISGRVTDEAGRPVTHFEIKLREKGEERPNWTSFRTSDGTFEVTQLAAGEYSVQVESSDFADSASTQVAPKRGERVSGVDFILNRGRNLRGIVLEERGRRPLAGASVSAEGRYAKTGADGRFDLKALPAGVLELEADHDGFATRQLRIGAGPISELSIAMRRIEGTDGGWARDYEGIGVQLNFETVLDGGSGYVVIRLHPEGGARVAGVELGDEVMAADGVVPVGLSPQEFNLHIRGEEGSAVRLTIRRGGRVFDLNVARRRLTW